MTASRSPTDRPEYAGWLFPEAQAALFPKEVRPVLYVLSTIGLTLYMFLVGAGLDHSARSPGEVRKASVLATSARAPAAPCAPSSWPRCSRW